MNTVEDLFPTRQSLLRRLNQKNDQQHWRDFFEAHWKLIYSFAIKKGLSAPEAKQVVEDTILSVLDPQPGLDAHQTPFKTWLLHLTEHRITQQLSRRNVEGKSSIDNWPDQWVGPASRLSMEHLWNEEYESNLMAAALERVKKAVDARQYQVFDLYVFKKWPVTRVARALNLNPGKVFLAKHRITHLIKKELAHLRSKPVRQ